MALKINKDFATFYGIMLGDGCLSLFNKKKKFIVIAGSLKDDVPFFERIVQPIINHLINKTPKIVFRPSKGAIYLHFINSPLFDFTKTFGYPLGKKGNQLYIPKEFFNKNLVKYLIQGFFATDGSLVITNNNGITYPRIEANGIAKELLLEISNFLNNQDINCKFYKAKRRSFMGFKNRQTQYRLQINGRFNLELFKEKIGFINPKQIDKLNNYYGCTKN